VRAPIFHGRRIGYLAFLQRSGGRLVRPLGEIGKMIDMTYLALLGLGAAAAFAMVVAAFRKWPQAPLYCVTVFATTVWDFPNKPPLATVLGSSIHIEDVILLAALCSVAVNSEQFWKTVRPYKIIVVTSAICVGTSLIAGLITFGSNTAINEFRSFFYPLGMVVWFLNQEWTTLQAKRRFRRWAVVTGIAITAAGIMHVGLYGLGKADSFVVSAVSGEEMTGRPLTSDQAVMLVFLGILMFALKGREKRQWDSLLGLVFIIFSVVCQQRSAWLALALAMVPIVFRLRGAAGARFYVGIFFASLIAAIVILSGAAGDVISSLVYSLQSAGTYVGRVDSWSTLVNASFERGYGSVIFGQPFGFGYLREDYRGFMISYAPHNWYVSIFLRLGLVGLVLFMSLLVWIFLRLARGADKIVSMSVFLGILAYLWSYSLSWHVGVFFAWTLAVAVQTTPLPVQLRTPRRSTSESDGEEPMIKDAVRYDMPESGVRSLSSAAPKGVSP
jgi:hypothetical protein